MDLELDNKIVIVTGANGGIGAELCKAFLKENAIVIPFVRNTAAKMDFLLSWANENSISKERIYPVATDLTNFKIVKQDIDTLIEKFGKIDILVNNAGHTVEKPFLMLEEDEWDDIISINLTSVARLSKIVMKHMLSVKSGNIINVSSTVASSYGRGVAAYSAAKAAVNRLTEVIALEMGRKGLRVNTVCPGVIKTKMSDLMVERIGKHIYEHTPMRRIGEVDEVTPAVLFLASEKTASFITGQHIYINGGVNL